MNKNNYYLSHMLRREFTKLPTIDENTDFDENLSSPDRLTPSDHLNNSWGNTGKL